MYAEILTIGDELCRGEVVDTNSTVLAGLLWDLGIEVRWMTSCLDRDADMVAALSAAAARADLIVTSGGLGPTEDDRTVDVLAGLIGQPAVEDAPARSNLEARAKALGIDVTPTQARQVRVPAGARVFANRAGAAPGFEVALGRVPVIALPGVPRELTAIVDDHLRARWGELARAAGAPTIARRVYRVFGRGEGHVAGLVDAITLGVPGATLHYQAKFPETLVKLVVRDAEPTVAEAALARLDVDLRARIGRWIYGTGGTPQDALPEVVCARLRQAGLRVGTAESCTGGLIAEVLTRPAGASGYFVGAQVTYADAEKVRALGVAPELLSAHGAVSEEVARAMALGACARLGVDLAVAATGIAGPGGGSESKPVGTVWVAVALVEPGAGPGAIPTVLTRKLHWPGARDMVRTLTAWWACKLIADVLDGRAAEENR